MPHPEKKKTFFFSVSRHLFRRNRQSERPCKVYACWIVCCVLLFSLSVYAYNKDTLSVQGFLNLQESFFCSVYTRRKRLSARQTAVLYLPYRLSRLHTVNICIFRQRDFCAHDEETDAPFQRRHTARKKRRAEYRVSSAKMQKRTSRDADCQNGVFLRTGRMRLCSSTATGYRRAYTSLSEDARGHHSLWVCARTLIEKTCQCYILVAQNFLRRNLWQKKLL